LTTADWHWKPEGGDNPGLRYEPGHWGDLLKLLWLQTLATELLQRSSATALSYCDPFAGAPGYPLPPRSRRRASCLAAYPVMQTLAPFLRQNRWPGSASFVTELTRQQQGVVTAQVFDGDATRAEELKAVPELTFLAGDCGYSVAEDNLPGEEGLLLLDPYDFIADEESQAARLAACLGKTNILIYLYNRAGRGRDELRRYRKLRNRLEARFPPEQMLWGRVPADSFLPDSHHEMLYCAAATATGREVMHSLAPTLKRQTLSLTTKIQEQAFFEQGAGEEYDRD
jgi:hypothetical protein